MIETVMWIPVIATLLFGSIEVARVTYTYFTLHKILYTVASYLGTERGVNFCDEQDPAITRAVNLALLGGIGSDTGGGQPIVQGLEADQISIRIERLDPETDQLTQCDCSETGCDASVGGLAPDYIVVSIPNGYPMQIAIPGLNLDPIPLRPSIRLPYRGT
jgi:hypothetical protein